MYREIRVLPRTREARVFRSQVQRADLVFLLSTAGQRRKKAGILSRITEQKPVGNGFLMQKEPIGSMKIHLWQKAGARLMESGTICVPTVLWQKTTGKKAGWSLVLSGSRRCDDDKCHNPGRIPGRSGRSLDPVGDISVYRMINWQSIIKCGRLFVWVCRILHAVCLMACCFIILR